MSLASAACPCHFGEDGEHSCQLRIVTLHCLSGLYQDSHHYPPEIVRARVLT